MLREVARQLGLSRYIDDKPCKYGHTSERRVKDNRCMECDREYKARERQEQPDRVRKNKARDYLKHHDKRKATMARRRERDPELVRQEKSEDYQKNKQAYKERAARWKKNNRGRAAQINAERKKRVKLATPIWLTDEDRAKIREIYETCPEGYHVDHIIPLKGALICGLHHPNNLQHLTGSENSRKRNRWVLEDPAFLA